MQQKICFKWRLVGSLLALILMMLSLSGCFFADALIAVLDNSSYDGGTRAPQVTDSPTVPAVTAPPRYTVKDTDLPAAISLENTSAVPDQYKDDFVTIKNTVVQIKDTVVFYKSFSGMDSSNYRTVCEKETALLLWITKLVKYSCPELFYIGAYQVSWYYPGKGNSATFTLTFTDMFSKFGTKAQIQAMNTQVQNKIVEIVDQAKVLTTAFAREVFIHDYLVKNITYNMDESKSYIRNIYGALVVGECVCVGYAQAFQALMLRLGEDTFMITGTAGEAHAWNIIELYGQLYQVDVTWDDPTPNRDVSAEASKYLISHAYLNQTDAFMAISRTYNQEDDFIPFSNLACTSSDLNYFRIMGMQCDSIEVYKAILYKYRDSFPDGYTRCIEVQFTCPITDEQVTAAIDEVRLADGSYKYSRSVNSETGVAKIYNW